jgi:hypothetical protein
MNALFLSGSKPASIAPCPRSTGETGQIPPGWDMPPLVVNAGYRAELRHQDCGRSFSSCVAYVPPPVIGTVRAAELAQTFPADPL